MEGQDVGGWVDVNVSVDDAHMGEIEDLVDTLKTEGMRIDHVLRAIGTVSGRLPLAKLDQVRFIEGVSHVERAREIQLAPPEDDVQ
jgi:hypothetical protein